MTNALRLQTNSITVCLYCMFYICKDQKYASHLFEFFSGSYFWSTCARSFCSSTSSHLSYKAKRNYLPWERRWFIKFFVSRTILLVQCSIFKREKFRNVFKCCSYCLMAQVRYWSWPFARLWHSVRNMNVGK